MAQSDSIVSDDIPGTYVAAMHFPSYRPDAYYHNSKHCQCFVVDQIALVTENVRAEIAYARGSERVSWRERNAPLRPKIDYI
jgi:hypothetical protein